MATAYYAGLLGKGTKHLPLTNKEISYGETDNYTFVWVLNASDMPTSFTSSYTNQYGSYTDDPVIFKW